MNLILWIVLMAGSILVLLIVATGYDVEKYIRERHRRGWSSNRRLRTSLPSRGKRIPIESSMDELGSPFEDEELMDLDIEETAGYLDNPFIVRELRHERETETVDLDDMTVIDLEAESEKRRSNLAG